MKKLPATRPLWLLALAFGISTGCQSDNDLAKPGNNSKGCLITKITYAGTDAITYQYNNQKHLLQAQYSGGSTNAENYLKTYEYDAAGRVTKEIFKNSQNQEYGYFAFEYNEKNEMSKISYFTKTPGSNTYTHQYDKEIVYTGGNRIAKIFTTNPANSQVGRYDIYIYDSNQNITKIIENTVAGSTTTHDVTTEFTYDDKKNPFYNATYLGVGAETKSRNNILTEKVTYHLSGQIKNYSSTYQYNQNGYPVKQTRVSDTNVLEVIRDYACVE